MNIRTLRSPLEFRLRRTHSTVRWRLTLLYGGLFLACGTALLVITYALVAHATLTPAVPHVFRGPVVAGRVPSGPGLSLAVLDRLLGSGTARAVLDVVGRGQRISDLHKLVIWSAIALAIMAIVSGALGWLVAGRVLAPLRTITSTTREISETNLHQRLAIPGPRDELGQLADTIDGLLERLESAFEAQRRFVANASHELRTPLTTMRATLDVAIAKPHVPPQTQALNTNLREDLDQADRLLESFLVLARTQHGALGELTSVSLAQIAADALARRGEAIAQRQIELHTTLVPVRVNGSETLLTRMVENVIENAVRHNEAHGFINVACDTEADMALLIVESGGQPVDQHAVAQLAEPFRRLGPERTGAQNGHGLGLSIVGAVATAHGGSLELTACPQGGLRVQITLPRAPVAHTTPASV